MENKIDELRNKIKENSLVISRVPQNTKDDFLNLANAEFCGDYGMTLKHLMDNFKLSKLLFENINMKLDYILESISQPEQKEEKPTSDIQLVSGKKIGRNRTEKEDKK